MEILESYWVMGGIKAALDKNQPSNTGSPGQKGAEFEDTEGEDIRGYVV